MMKCGQRWQKPRLGSVRGGSVALKASFLITLITVTESLPRRRKGSRRFATNAHGGERNVWSLRSAVIRLQRRWVSFVIVERHTANSQREIGFCCFCTEHAGANLDCAVGTDNGFLGSILPHFYTRSFNIGNKMVRSA
ncbi:hypothetical protein CEXT_421861 [Caerostris extrusa]|uniref:Secreted protein n=1 Tax=Caerostris extrusa TaxID=172846 RepID=A0AAV4UID5_CAEEX|nr:hypothetical protein CEXT_421861 [Caerostris extrusa]